MNKTLLTYIESALISFVSVFILALGSELQAGMLTPDNFSFGIVLSIAVAAFRTAVKGIYSYAINRPV